MTNEIKETLEGLEKRVEIHKTLIVYMWGHEKKCKLKLIDVLSTAITWGKALEEAGEELGEKKKIDTFGVSTENAYNSGFNQMHSIALPIIAKYKLRITELEEEIRRLK